MVLEGGQVMDKAKKLGELYSHRELTHTRAVEHLKDIRPDLYNKHPEGKNPSSKEYWDTIKDMTADEFIKALNRTLDLGEKSGSLLRSERKVTLRVIDRICRDGLYNRRINDNDRRISRVMVEG